MLLRRGLLGALLTSCALLCGGTAVASAVEVQVTPIRPVMTDGVALSGVLIMPTAPGRYPAVVIPSAWAGPGAQNEQAAKWLAERGYIVLGYAPRGMIDSDGAITMAGPQDTADARRLIDFLIRYTPTDPHRIGMVGFSYGGGISLLTAPTDPRIRAVASMSGWADLTRSLRPNGARSALVAGGLFTTSVLSNRASDQMKTMFFNYFLNVDVPGQLRFGTERSAAASIAAYNRNRPALLIAQAWSETVFPPGQVIDFFNAYQGPKRLELRPGDHGSGDTTGFLAPWSIDIWNGVYAFFDKTLRLGTPDDLGTSVMLRPRSSDGAKPDEEYPSWAAVEATGKRLYLGPKGGIDSTGTLPIGPVNGWNTTLTAGINLAANGGIALYSGGLEAITGKPPTVALGLVSKDHTALWQSDPTFWPLKLRGTPRVHVTVTPQDPQGVLVAYLYDVDQNGVAYHVGHQPFTWHGRQPYIPFEMDLALEPVAYDLPAGHRLAVAISTWESLYAIDANRENATIALSSPDSDPSYLQLPTR